MRRTAETASLRRVGQRRAGDEIDEYLGCHLVEAENGDLLARGDRELRDAERPEALIILGNVRELEDRASRSGWTMASLTSSTMRLDAASASISIFAAARLQAIAPYAIMPCTIGGSTPVSTLAPRIAAIMIATIANVPIEKTGLRATAMRR